MPQSKELDITASKTLESPEENSSNTEHGSNTVTQNEMESTKTPKSTEIHNAGAMTLDQSSYLLSIRPSQLPSLSAYANLVDVHVQTKNCVCGLNELSYQTSRPILEYDQTKTVNTYNLDLNLDRNWTSLKIRSQSIDLKIAKSSVGGKTYKTVENVEYILNKWSLIGAVSFTKVKGRMKTTMKCTHERRCVSESLHKLMVAYLKKY